MPRPSSHKVSREEALKSFGRKDLAPVYLFFGEEEYFVDELVDGLIASAVEPSSRDFDLEVVYGPDISSQEIVERASAYPMTGGRRVVVVREFDKLANKEEMVPYIERPSPATSLVATVVKPDFRQKVYKAFDEHGVTVECRALYESEVAQWIASQCERRGVSISFEASELVHDYTGRTLRDLKNALDKLFLYIDKKKEIGVGDVNAVVGFTKQHNMFELQACIGQRDFARSLEIAERMLQAGESPVGLVAMFTRYLGKLWIICDCLSRKAPRQEIAEALRLSPKQMYFLDAEIRAASRFSLADVEDGFLALAEADERLKTSDGTPLLVMTLLLHRLFRSEQILHETRELA